jgi:catechol 2,3-dioxygenase-like lactoylglutathione lyase family enzyme
MCIGVSCPCPEPSLGWAQTSIYAETLAISRFARGVEFLRAGPGRIVQNDLMDARISLVTLGVKDLDRSIRFYRDGLGLPQRDGPPDIAFFTMGATWLSLYPRESLAEDAGVEASGTGFPGFALAHNVRTREAVDALIEQAVRAGAQLQKKPEEASWGGYSGYFRDPDGFLWEVAWNPHFWIGDD